MKQTGLSGKAILQAYEKSFVHHNPPNTHLMYLWLQVTAC